MAKPAPQIHGILVTFRRPAHLATMLDRLASQTRRLDSLTVVDNSPHPETRASVEKHTTVSQKTDYLPSEENLGPAGGISRAMDHVMEMANDDDWVLLLDDDDPPSTNQIVEQLLVFAVEALTGDPKTAGVAFRGARFDRRRGRVVRIEDGELGAPVPVDHFGGNQLPLYRFGAIRDVGPFFADLFFGFEELEYGLRLRDAGYSLYAHGSLWGEARAKRAPRQVRKPQASLEEPDWRRYYSLRNLIYILRRTGHPWAAARVTLARGLAKPLANLPVRPSLAIRHLRLNGRASRDAWRGRLGRTLPPEDSL